MTSKTTVASVIYDEINDQYTKMISSRCESSQMNDFSIAMFIIDFLPLLLLAMFTYVKRFFQWKSKYRTLAFALFNFILIMFIAIAAILLTKSYLARELVASLAILVISISTPVAMIYFK